MRIHHHDHDHLNHHDHHHHHHNHPPSLLVVRGARGGRPRLLLPWLLLHILVILGAFAGGLYLVLLHTVVARERGVVLGLAGLGPVSGGALLLLLWLPVDQLYVSLRRSTGLLIEVAPSLRGTLPRSLRGTLPRPLSSLHRPLSRTSCSTLRSGTKRRPPALLRAEDRSRSLEHILRSSSPSLASSPGSLVFPCGGAQTLPRWAMEGLAGAAKV